MASPALSTSRYGRARKPVQYGNMRSEWSSDATSDDGDDSEEDGDSEEEEEQEQDGGNESDSYVYEYDPLDQTEDAQIQNALNESRNDQVKPQPPLNLDPDSNRAAAATASSGGGLGVGEQLEAGQQRMATGLGNLGNTCFVSFIPRLCQTLSFLTSPHEQQMNSTLQCLAHTAPLRDYFLSGRFRRDLNTENPLGTRGELAKEFASLLTEMWRRTPPSTGAAPHSPTTYPLSFKSALEKHAPRFAGQAQHDSQELLMCLLDALHEDTNLVTSKPYAENPEQGPDVSDADASEAAWSAHLDRENSRINKLFMGQVKNRLQCPVTKNTSTTFDPNMFLSVPIPGDASRVTLMDCISKYSEREQLDEGEMWYCSQCKDHVRAWKELHIYRTPPILIIHLKRFHFSAATHRREKIDTHVDFPLEGLDLRDSVNHREGNGVVPVYDCYAMSCHFGGVEVGHYTACCKEEDGTWSNCNDGLVVPNVDMVDEREVVGPAAYCLYYKRRDVEFSTKVVFEEDGDDDEESGASKDDSGDTTARRDPSAPNEDEATEGKWNISDCVQIGVDMSAEAASLLGRNFDDSARTEQTDSTGTARYPWSISECCVPEECENEEALSCLGHTFDLEEERNKGKRGLDDDVTFGDGGSSGNEEGDDDFMAKFPLPKNAGGRFVGWDGMPRQRDPERDKKMSGVFQRRHTNELSDDEEGEDFSNVDGFNKASRMRDDNEDPTRLDLGDVACAPTVTEKENGQSHVGSDDQMDWFRKQGEKNYEENPHKDQRFSGGKPSTLFSIDVLIDENGELETDGEGKWKRVSEGYGTRGTSGMLGTSTNIFNNMAQGDEILFPRKESGTGNEISAKFIKVTALKTEGDKDDDNLHEPSNEDKRLLVEAKEALRSLTCPENKLVFTGFDGCFIDRYTGLGQFREASSVVVTRDQLDPYETFKATRSITKECVWESDNRRYIYIRNSELGPGYLELWSEDIHGEWSTIRKGGSNPAHNLPEETIKEWRVMTRRNVGRQSKGRVYELDVHRKVIEYKKSWKEFGLATGANGIRIKQVKEGARKGFEIRGRRFVHATQLKNGETYDIGGTLPEIAPEA